MHTFYFIVITLLLSVLSACSSTTKQVSPELSTNKSHHSQSPRRPNNEKVSTNNGELSAPPAIGFVKKQQSSVSELDSLNEAFDTLDFEEYQLGAHKLFAIEFSNPILFEYNKSHIDSSKLEEVGKFAKIFNESTMGDYLYVVGHTDSRGTQQYNQSLSMRRSLVVAELLSKQGVSTNKIKLVPAGEVMPKYSNSTELLRSKNRRVEIYSANSQELVKAFLREINCNDIDNACKQSYLPIKNVKIKGDELVIDSVREDIVITQAPGMNNLTALNNSLEQDIKETDRRFLSQSEKSRFSSSNSLIREPLSLTPEIRPSLIFIKEIRKSLILPAKYYFIDKKS